MKSTLLISLQPMKFSQLSVVALAAVLLSSCASVQREAAPSQPDRPERGKGLVVFYRERHFVGGGVGYNVRDNGTKIGGLPNGSYFVYQANPGTHTFSAATEATDEKPVKVEAGRTYYVRGEIQVGVLVGRPHLTIVAAEEGSNAIKNLRRVKLKP